MTENPENAQAIPPKIVDTLTAAAGATGYSETLLQLLKERGCHAFKSGRVNLDELAAYATDNPEEFEKLEDQADSSDQLDDDLKREKLRRMKQANDVQAGQLIARADAATRIESLGVELKNVLRLRLEDELPRELVGKSEDQVRAAMAGVVDELCEKFSHGTEWTK